MDHFFKPKGVCSRGLNFETDGRTLHKVRFQGGCPGNLQGLAKLAEGRPLEEVIELLSGLRCGDKKTSCPDQLARALKSCLPKKTPPRAGRGPLISRKSGLLIRRTEPGDLKELLAVYGPYVTDTAISFEYEVPTEEQFKSRFEETARQFPWLTAEADGRPVGYACASPAFSRPAYQWTAALAVYVAEEFHRRGLATALYDGLETILFAQGYYLAYALVTSANEHSLTFHRQRGFREAGFFGNCGFKLGNWLAVTWLEKILRPASDPPPAPPKPFSALDPARVEASLKDAGRRLNGA